jgi:LysR family transcriptional regulator of gallate degradation
MADSLHAPRPRSNQFSAAGHAGYALHRPAMRSVHNRAEENSSMELRQLRHFVAVAEERNFSVAARRVNLSQPALTRSIKTLEDTLQTRLLERGPQGTVPTPAGERFLEHARMILNDCDRARTELRSFRTGVTGRVSFGIAAMFSSWIADAVVERVGTDLPGVELEVTEGFYEDLVARLRSGRIDFALTNLPPVALDVDLQAEPLMELAARVVCGAAHPLARRRGLKAVDLAEARWVIVNRPHSLELFRQYFVEQGAPVPQVTATDSLGLIRSLVAHGTHLSIVTEPVVHRELRRGAVKVLKVETSLARRRAGLLYVKRAAQRGAVERVMTVARDCCATGAKRP